MEPDRAKEIIRALADGVDPYTGEGFPADGPYQRADTVRALYLALAALEGGGKTAHPRVIDPRIPKAGGPWSPEEDQQLRDAFAAGVSPAAIANTHGRTQGAITSRLAKLGLLVPTATPQVGRGNTPDAGTQMVPRPPGTPSHVLTQEENDALPF